MKIFKTMNGYLLQTLAFVFVLPFNGQTSEVCRRKDTCGHQTYGNLTYTCEQRYAKATRCLLLTVTKVVRMAEIETMHSILESGLEKLDKAIENLKCKLQKMKNCKEPGQCKMSMSNEKCEENSNGTSPNVTKCKDGYTYYCEGRDPGTSQSWCMKHCSVGWPQCNVYCNCTCRSDEIRITTTPLPGIPQCELDSELNCKGTLAVIQSSWCNNYCRRNGPLCSKYCDCQCERKNGAGFLTQKIVTTSTVKPSTTSSTTTTKSTTTTRPTSSPVSCRPGFVLKCHSKNRWYSSGWCTSSCKAQDSSCPDFCKCTCRLRQGGGFLPDLNDKTTTLAPTTLTTSTTPMSTTTTQTTTKSTTPTTEPLPNIVKTTRSPFFDMCETGYKFGCKGRQVGVRQEWCTKYCLIGWEHCNNFCFCSCILVTTTSISTTTTTKATTTTTTTTPSTTVLITTAKPTTTTALSTATTPWGSSKMSTRTMSTIRTTPFPLLFTESRQPLTFTTMPNLLSLINPQQETSDQNYETEQCPVNNIRCTWIGPNLGNVNKKLKGWCENVCAFRTKYCIDLRHICRCGCLKMPIRKRVCGASQRKTNHIGVSDWCKRNCDIGFCPITHCSCKYILQFL